MNSLSLSTHLDGVGPQMLKIVSCDAIDTFPDINIKFGDTIIKLEAKYYIENSGGMCFSKLFGQDHSGKRWLLGTPFLTKYYSVYNMGDSPSVTFYKAK